jgi:hypothetical protein
MPGASSLPVRAGEGANVWIEQAMSLIETCRVLGIEEVSICGFTKDDLRRAPRRSASYQRACVELARRAFDDGAEARFLRSFAGSSSAVAATSASMCS